MIYFLSTLIAALALALYIALKKLYNARFELMSKSKKDNSVLRNTWNRFDELLTSLINIHEIGIGNVGNVKKEEFYDMVLNSACGLVRSRRGSLMIYNEKKEEVEIVKSKGISAEVIKNTRLKMGTGIAGRVFQSGETVFVTDPGENDRYEGYIGASEQKESFIALPLKSNEKTFGVLNIHLSTEKNSFSDYDLKFLNLLASEAAITLENIKLYESIENFYLEMVQTLARVIDAKDAYTGDHAGRARKKARLLAEGLSLPKKMIKYIEYAALLHDIGKIGINGAILTKPGRLDVGEYDEIKKHPRIGYNIISPIKFLAPVAKMVLYHQEWYNGMGYPEGLKGEEIPIGARIVSIIDAWDAMVSDRPYRRALTYEEAIREIKKGTGTQFDPNVVEVFTGILKSEKGLNSADDSSHADRKS